MPISKPELEKMNGLIESGKTIADVYRAYPQYTYSEVYTSVNDYSLLGKKRSITNRLFKLKSKTSTQAERTKLVNEVNKLITEIYKLSKRNGNKLSEIMVALDK